jgi:hypothetical protein
MSDLDPKRAPDHLERAFLRPSEPEPFWKTKEFGRFAALAGVALFSLLLFAYFGLRQAEQAERDAELAKAAWPALTAVERQARLDAQTNLFEGALRDSQSGQGFVQTPGYLKLLDSLKRYKPEDVSQRAQRTLDYTTLVTDPEPWRGEFVRMRGLVGGMWAERLPGPIFEHKDVWRGLLTDGEGDNGVMFDILERPENADSLHRQAVDVEAVYYRNVAYTAENGESRTVPWILVKSIALVPSAAETSYKATLADNTLLIIALLAFAVLAARVLFSSLRKKRRAAVPAAAPQSIRDVLEANRRKAGIRPSSNASTQSPSRPQSPSDSHQTPPRR